MRIAAIADLHCRTESGDEVKRWLDGIQQEAEVFVMAGDLTNLGLVEEMEVLLGALSEIALPKVAVMGNHDHESDQIELLEHMMGSAGIRVLDGDVWEHDGVAFVGTKGFAGGFGACRLQPFGETMLKTFVRASMHEVVRLETALEQVEAQRRVAILHYAPISETLRGEHLEVYPFLGFSLLADALDRHGVDLIVHGHAHHGSPSGTTPGGIPVHNVSRYVQCRHFERAYSVFDV